MASNRVIGSLNVATIVKGGKELTLAVATKTELRERPAAAVQAIVPGFQKSAEKHEKPLPAGTAKLVAREGSHQSENEKRDHYTVVCEDANGKYITTEHIPAKE